MIGHYCVSSGLDILLVIYDVEPFIDQVVSVAQLKQRKPLITGECDTIERRFVTMYCSGGH